MGFDCLLNGCTAQIIHAGTIPLKKRNIDGCRVDS